MIAKALAPLLLLGLSDSSVVQDRSDYPDEDYITIVEPIDPNEIQIVETFYCSDDKFEYKLIKNKEEILNYIKVNEKLVPQTSIDRINSRLQGGWSITIESPNCPFPQFAVTPGFRISYRYSTSDSGDSERSYFWVELADGDATITERSRDRD